MAVTSLRLDKLLWHLRLSKSRSLAQVLIAQGHVRINGKRIEKSSFEAKIDDVIVMPKGEDTLVIRLVVVPMRRGPAAEVREYYAEI